MKKWIKVVEEFFDTVLTTLVVALGCLDIFFTVMCVVKVNGVETSASEVSKIPISSEVIEEFNYDGNVTDKALAALFYSSKIGVADGGMRKSTLDCYRYIGNDISVIHRYNNSVGLVHVITKDKETLYLVIEEPTDSYVIVSPSTYDEYISDR